MTQLILKLSFVFILLQIFSNSNAQDFEVSPVKMDFFAEPGETQIKPITIINHSNKSSSFTLTLGDFIINKTGNPINMPAASTEHSLANWISINPPFIQINPNEEKQVIVSIQAPVGDYSSKWANIFIRSTTEQTAFMADKKIQTGMLVEGQIIIRIFQSPKSNINYRMKITGLSEISLTTDSVRQFKAIVDNLGEKISDCKVTLLASSLSTGEEFKLQVVKFKSLPDSQLDIILQIPNSALPKGRYSLAAILDYGKQSNLEGTQMLIMVD